MASTRPTEAEYTAAMERHGTDAWTADDARTAERYLARDSEIPDETAAEVADKPAEGTNRRAR